MGRCRRWLRSSIESSTNQNRARPAIDKFTHRNSTGVGYVDNVATFPEARGQGYASAIVTRVVERALSAGASHICLFADPGADAVVRMYERLGFRGVGRVASTLGGADDLRRASARQTR